MNVKVSAALQEPPRCEELAYNRPHRDPVQSVFQRPVYLRDFRREEQVHTFLSAVTDIDYEGRRWRVRSCLICNREIYAVCGSQIMVNSTSVVVRCSLQPVQSCIHVLARSWFQFLVLMDFF
jgi:hypothetical protein